MLVTTATSGVYSSSEPSLSSASATKQSPLPWWALVPASPSSPPTANDGSSPQCCSATISIDVVVVLPWVPVTISVRWPAISLASTAGRSTTGMPRRRASTSSGLVFGIAAWVVITRGRRRPAADPATTRRGRCGSARPGRAARSTPRDSLASEPDTSPPRSSRMRAMPGHAGSADADHVHPLRVRGAAPAGSPSLRGRRVTSARPAIPGRRPPALRARRPARPRRPAAPRRGARPARRPPSSPPAAARR